MIIQILNVQISKVTFYECYPVVVSLFNLMMFDKEDDQVSSI